MNVKYLDCIHLGKGIGLNRVATKLVESFMYIFLDHVLRWVLNKNK